MRAFLDTTVPVYASGEEHEQRSPSLRVLESASQTQDLVFASSEVLQEVLNIYVRRRQAGRAVEVIRDLVGTLGRTIVAVSADDVVEAAMATFHAALSARDRVHIAVMRRLGIEAIISADHGFDLVPGVRRLDPLEFATWRAEVFG